MGTYTSIGEVQALLPNDKQLTAASSPSIPQATVWISQAEAACDVALASGGATAPATDASQKLALGLICCGEVVYRVCEKQSPSSEKVEETTWWKYHEAFEAALTLMRDGGWAGDVTGANTVGLPSSDVSIDPWFTRAKAEY